LSNPRLVADIVRPEEAEEECACDLLTAVVRPHLSPHKADNVDAPISPAGPTQDLLIAVHHFYAKPLEEGDEASPAQESPTKRGRVERLVGLPFTLVLRSEDTAESLLKRALCRIGAADATATDWQLAVLDDDGGFTILRSEEVPQVRAAAGAYPRLGLLRPSMSEEEERDGNIDRAHSRLSLLRDSTVCSPIISGVP
jgi:hypothetical protein